MSLRTYPLIAHPAFLRFIEGTDKQLSFLKELAPSEVPAHLPVIKTPYEISKYLGVHPLMIRSFVRNKEKHYRTFYITKRSGDLRTISAPRTFLKVAQWWILDTILDNKSELPFVYGFTKGKSFIDNARQHHGARHVLNVDIKDFFPSVTTQAVEGIFQVLGYNKTVSSFLAEICTYEGALPQGSPSSPKLSNFALYQCDIKLQNLAVETGVRYTRYADDLTFSSENRIPAEIVDNIKHILSSSNFVLNDKKTRFMGANQTKEVTGLTLGKDGVALSRDFINGTRGWFHKISTAPDHYQGHLNRVMGTLNLIEQVGGRGSQQLLQAGRKAAAALTAASPPKLEWGKE